MSTTTATNPAANVLEITKDRVKAWSACSNGYRWFLNKFPEGGAFADVHKALIEDKRGSDADWLVGKAFDEFDTETRVKQIAVITGADAKAIAERVAAGAEAATTGEWANAATTGDWANAATTGEGANAATTGDWANAATTGEWANAATTGDRANAATTGDRANAATTGEGANAATTGEGSVAAALGMFAKAKAGVGGAIVLAHRDDSGALLGVKAAMVGQDGIEPDVFYELDGSGNFVKLED